MALRYNNAIAAVLLLGVCLGSADGYEISKQGRGRRALLQLTPAPSPGDGTNVECCARLAAIKFQSNLPVVIVDTHGAEVTRDATNSSLCTCSQGLQKGDLSAEVGFRIRGGTNSQKRNRIFQYAIDIDDKKWFLGMPKSRKWMLHAQELDPFDLHQWTGFNLTRATGEYAAKTQHCELFLINDGAALSFEAHYRGIYLGMEKVRQETNRVNIADNNNPADVSGGYIMEFRHGQNEKNQPTVNGTRTNKQWNVVFPQEDTITPAQVTYLQKYLNDFEGALFAENFADPVEGWRKYANETAWVDWFLAAELIRNVKHTYHSAAFITKDNGKKWRMGPYWNAVQGFGTCCGYPVQGYDGDGTSPPNPASGGNGVSSSGWLFSVCENGNCPVLDKYAPDYGISVWFIQLWEDSTWVSACAKRYEELRQGPWATVAVQANINSLIPYLKPAGVRTLTRWAEVLYKPDSFPSKEAQFEFTVKQVADWTTARLMWLDGAFKQALTPGQAEGPYPSGYPPSEATYSATLPASSAAG